MSSASDTMAELYERHAQDPLLRLLLGEYQACVAQLERSAMAMRVFGEPYLALALEARARDITHQAARAARYRAAS